MDISKGTLGVFLLAASVIAVSHSIRVVYAATPGTVTSLTSKNFQQVIQDHDLVLVEFYAPWCGHCKKLEPEYIEAAKRLENKPGVVLAKVDATEEQDLATQHDVQGYPTLYLFKKGVRMEFEGGRNADGIVEWLEMMSGPAIRELSSVEDAKTAAANYSVSFVGHFSKDSDEYKHYEIVSDKNRQHGVFFAVITSGGPNEVTVHRADEDSITHKIESEEKLQHFVGNESLPLFGPINGENYSKYVSRTQELVWFCGSASDYKDSGIPIRKAAAKYRDELSFVWLDVEQFGSHAENALGVSDFPALVYQAKAGRYVYPEKVGTDENKLIQFFKDVKDGKIAKNLKSEPTPEKNDEPVKVVVGNTFKEMVLQKDKDVMLEVYAPWCGHCKRLDPVYQSFAEKMASEDHIIVAKMDGTANEAPVENFEWSGFPTIFYIPAGKDTPLKFDGPRTLEGLVEYVAKHSSKPVSVSVPTGKDEL